MARIFISHSHKDEAEAIALRDWLISQGWGGEDDIFLDLDPKRGLVGGERWEEALRRNVRRCEAIVFVVTPDWCKSKWCFSELQQAKNLNKPIFGIIAKPIEMSNIPIEMTAEWQLVDLTRAGAQEEFDITAVSDGKAHEVSFNASELTRLKAGLENTGIDPSYFEWPPEGELNRAPYQGLRAMQSQDAGIFFGRDGQILEGLDRLRGLHDAPPPRMLVILGASGAGKSSYMRAGLLPRLKRDDRHFVVLDSIRPGDNVLSGETGFVNALKHTLEAHDIAASPRRIKQAIGEALEENGDPSSLYDLLHQLASSHVDDTSVSLPSIVIPVDQAEELYFNQDESGAPEAAQFRQLLSLLARDERLNIILLLTIRSDSYQHMQLDTVLGGVEHQTLSLPPIAQGSYSQIILGPVQRLTMNSDRRLAIEEKLVERLLHDIAQGGAKDALPLLAFTLERLYSEYLEGDTLTLQDYEDMGGIRGSIEAAVEQAFRTADQRGDANIPMEKQARLALLKRGLIPYLASVDPEHNGAVRRVAPLSSIPQEARPIMELLVEQRLLATDTRPELDDKDEPTGKLETTIEPAHEALLRQWGQLGEWLEEDREALSALDGVKRAVIEWDANDKGEAFLAHTAGRLESAEQVANDERFHDYLKQRDRNYLAACRKADNERRNKALEQQAKVTRRTRLALITVSILALFIGGIGLYALKQNEKLEIQKVELEKQTVEANTAKERAEKQTRIAEGQKVELEKQKDELEEQTVAANTAKVRAEEQTQLAEKQKVKLEEQKTSLAISLDHANLNQSKFLRSSALSAMSEGKHDDARALLKTAWDKIGGTYDPENPWSDHLAAAQRKLDSHDSLKMTLEGHIGAVFSAQLSPDGKTIVTASEDETAKLWDTKTGEQIETFSSHDDAVFSAQFSPDGKMLITASKDETAIVWDIKTGEQITVLKGHKGAIISAQFNPNGEIIVTASTDETARVWNTKTGEEVTVLKGHKDQVNSAQFSPNGKMIVTASTDETARVWNTKTGEEVTVLKGHEDQVNSAQFSPDGKMILTASSDGFAHVWDVETKEAKTVFYGHDASVAAAQFSADGSTVVTASHDNTARLWNTKTGEEIAVYEGHEDWLYSAQINPDGKTIVTASYDMTARIWNIKHKNNVVKLDRHDEDNQFISAQLSPDGKMIAIITNDKIMKLWNTETGEEKVALKGHENRVLNAQFSPDGKTIVTASVDKTARLWNTKTGEEIISLDGHKEDVNTARFSPDGRTIVTASDDDTARVWNIKTGEEIEVLEGHADWVASAQFSPNGNTILTASSDTTAVIWDAKTGKKIKTLEGHRDSVYLAQFSPDGKTIITASSDRTARLWSVETGETIAFLNNTTLKINFGASIQFSKDGNTILSNGFDERILLWDTKTGEQVNTNEFESFGVLLWASFMPGTNSVHERIITLDTEGLIQSSMLPKYQTSNMAELNAAHQMRLLSKDAINRYFLPENEDYIDVNKLNPCDATGGYAFDPNRIGPVLEEQTMIEDYFDSEALIKACEQALEKQPDEQRFRFQLARVLQSTLEVENERRAVKLLLEASQNGYAAASHWAALSYLGDFELDPEQVFDLLKLARSQGMVATYDDIAWAYWDGVGTSQDKPKAILTWQEGAKKSDPFSHKRLAQLYAKGELEEGNTLIKQDLNMAFYHYALATKIFEEAGDTKNAQETRYRRASLARTLPQDDVVRIWRKVKAWQPEGQ